MELKVNQKQGICLFLGGLAALLAFINNYLPKEYGFPILISEILLLIVAIILLFNIQKWHA